MSDYKASNLYSALVHTKQLAEIIDLLDFPDYPKNKEFCDRTQALIKGIIAIADLTLRENEV
jgi:hypothetical protein